MRSRAAEGDALAGLQGRWRIRRRSGLIPPVGVSKRIGPHSGCTLLFGIPVAWFRVRGRELRYRVLPIVDELTPGPGGSWLGTGRALGWEFCRFAMHPAPGDQRPGPGGTLPGSR